uniref:HNH nuclease domain-containing protein n=1 Tax=viral metagenome TaxID=1070528 RepID=A0A6C0KEQ7_9ZZZZ
MDYGRIITRPSLYRKYKVFPDGRVVNILTGHFLTYDYNSKGYARVKLYNDGQSTKLFVHRLVLYNFVGLPPPNKPEADHIDRDITNNNLSNLRWASRQENYQNRHGMRSDRPTLPSGVWITTTKRTY